MAEAKWPCASKSIVSQFLFLNLHILSASSIIRIDNTPASQPAPIREVMQSTNPDITPSSFSQPLSDAPPVGAAANPVGALVHPVSVAAPSVSVAAPPVDVPMPPVDAVTLYPDAPAPPDIALAPHLHSDAPALCSDGPTLGLNEPTPCPDGPGLVDTNSLEPRTRTMRVTARYAGHSSLMSIINQYFCRGLCKEEWLQVHPGGTEADFKKYWTDLRKD